MKFPGTNKTELLSEEPIKTTESFFFFSCNFLRRKNDFKSLFFVDVLGNFCLSDISFLFFFFEMIHWKGDRDAMPQVKNISITIHWILSDFFGFTFQAGCITLCDQPEKDFKTRNYSTDAIWSLLTLFFSNTSKIGHSGKEFNPA